jgi:hypothetical protein
MQQQQLEVKLKRIKDSLRISSYISEFRPQKDGGLMGRKRSEEAQMGIIKLVLITKELMKILIGF